MPPDLPKTIGRYQIEGELGRGMMGVVYSARDPALGRRIALKTVSDSFARSIPDEEKELFDQRFLAEARAAATLSHPGIIGVHDVGRDPETGILFIALEYLQGETLGQRLARGPVEWREAMRLTLRMAEALNHAHAHGVIHRDIKPANIMILESGEPKIMDFGIAKIPESQLTSAGQVFGTPLFMSPEQANGAPLDGRSDLFSLGAVLYHLLTRRHGFDAGSLPAIIMRLLHHEPDPPSSLNAALPEAVDYIVARLLAKSPDRRYPDGRTVAEDIADVLDGRVPRHRPAWESQPRGATAIEGLLDTAPPPVADRLLTTAGADARNRQPGETIGQSSRTLTLVRSLRASVARGSRRPVLPAATVALALAVGAVYVIWVRSAEEPPPTAISVTTATPGSTSDGPSLIERMSEALARSGTARISFGFEHSMKAVSLRVWVDEDLVVDRLTYGRVVRKFLGMESRKASLQEVLDVKPGPHEIKVRVAWDDNVKTEKVSRVFKAGDTRRLEADLGGLRKNLSLEWK